MILDTSIAVKALKLTITHNQIIQIARMFIAIFLHGQAYLVHTGVVSLEVRISSNSRGRLYCKQ